MTKEGCEFRARGEKQAVIFAAVKRELERVQILQMQARGGGWHFYSRNFSGPDARANAARIAQTGEVGRKAVRNIHHGRGDTTRGQGSGEGERNFRVEMWLKIFPGVLPLRESAQNQFQAKLRTT